MAKIILTNRSSIQVPGTFVKGSWHPLFHWHPFFQIVVTDSTLLAQCGVQHDRISFAAQDQYSTETSYTNRIITNQPISYENELDNKEDLTAASLPTICGWSPNLGFTRGCLNKHNTPRPLDNSASQPDGLFEQ